jgi:plastocyanin
MYIVGGIGAVLLFGVLIGLLGITLNQPTAIQAAQPAATKSVTIRDFLFEPQTITVTLNDRITWTNEDVAPHNSVAGNGAWTSPTLAQGASFTHIFDKVGSFSYICTIHPSMEGRVVVVAAGADLTPRAYIPIISSAE